jgi:hypothetical protein
LILDGKFAVVVSAHSTDKINGSYFVNVACPPLVQVKPEWKFEGRKKV